NETVVFTFQATAPATTTGSPFTFSGSGADNTTCTGTIAPTAQPSVTVNAAPSCTFSKTGGSDCAGTQDTFSGPAGLSYSWSLSANSSGATFASGTTSRSVTVNNGTSSGSYTLTLTTTSSGCSSSCSTTITVGSPTQPSAQTLAYSQDFSTLEASYP